MTDDLDNLSLAPDTNLAIQALKKVETSTKELPPPTFVADTVGPEDLASKWREWLGSVTDETSRCMSIHAEQERNEEMMSVPERLKRLLPDPMVCSGVHHEHAEQHDVPSDAASLRVVNLDSCFGASLECLNVEEASHVNKSCCANIVSKLT
jgi:hypothetical protein